MTVVPKVAMSVDEFLRWAEEQPGRYELDDGTVRAMAPETVGHAEYKAVVHSALSRALKAAGRPCRALPDGMTVRVDEKTAYEPDALVYCGPRLDRKAVEVPNPVVVVEVVSASTRSVDLSRKLAGYFHVPSVVHYLIVDPDKPLVVHHARGEGGTILTRIVTEGTIRLDPPGIELSISDIYTES